MQKLVVTCAAIALLATSSFAAEPWDSGAFAGTPADVLAAAAKVAPADADLVILLEEQRHTYAEDGSATTTQRLVYRVIEDSAVEDWGSVSSIWAPWYEERPIIEARVITRGGTVHQLDTAAISEAPAPEASLEIFSDNRVIRAPLPAVAAGSVVEHVITRRQRSPIAGAGSADAFNFGSWVPVQKARLVISSPESLTLNLENRTEPRLEPMRSTSNGVQTLTFEAGPIAPLEHYLRNLPYDLSNYQYVAFSTGKSWQDLAARYDEIVERQMNASSVESTAREAARGAKSRTEKIAAVLAWVQKNVRYAGVELGEGSIIPRTPATVMQNRYGDCKDKATLVAALLRANGIPARLALLRAGTDLDVHPALPGMGRFNHAIVYLPGDAAMWIDPTDEFSPAGELPAMDQGRLALVVDPSTTALLRTPDSESKSNGTIETRIIALTEEGKATIRETTEARGHDESSMRRQYASSDRKSYRESMEEYVQGHYGAESLKSLEAGDPRDLAKAFFVTVEAAETSRAQTGGGEAAVGIPLAGIVSDLPFGMRHWIDRDTLTESEKKKYRERTADFVFTPFTREWRYRVVPPTGYVARTLPAGETLNLGTTTLSAKYEIAKDGAIVATIAFDSGRRRLTATELRQTQKAVTEFQKRDVVIVAFDQIGQLKLNEGDVAGALAEFRRLAAMHPKEARHQVDSARAFLVGGMGDAARTTIDAAMKLEPGYAQGHRVRGTIYEHDLLGRPHRKGFDRGAGLAAYKRAVELDPKDIDFRKEYAKLLETGSDGIRYGHGWDVDGAVSQYRTIIDELKDDSVEADLVMALARGERFAELRDLGPKLDDARRRNFARIFATATLETAAAAIHEASAFDNAERTATLSAAGGILVAIRRYAAAADLLEAAMQGSPTTEQRGRIELIRKAKRLNGIAVDASDPKNAVLRLTHDLLIEEPDAKRIAEHFAADQRDLIRSGDDDTPWTAARDAVLAMARQQSLPVEFYADLGLSTMQVLVEGNDESGYRVRSRSAGHTDVEETFFVVRENDRYLISGSTKVPGLIGWSVFRLIDAGKMDAARQWLNWAREEFKAVNGDDPVVGLPFPRLWARSRPAATAEEMRLAAASLMIMKDYRSKSEPILLGARAGATEAQQDAIDLALAALYATSRDGAAYVAVAERIVARYPESESGFQLLVGAYTMAGRFADADALAQKRLARMPEDPEAMRALAETAMQKGDYKDAAGRFTTLLSGFKPRANDYNTAAWNALFAGSQLPDAVEHARRAIEMSGNAPAPMHTLAALYAETGQSLEAREALLESMDNAGRAEPASHDWYVLGRIAENYGARDAALAAYKRVEKPDKLDASDTYILATRRLKALGR